MSSKLIITMPIRQDDYQPNRRFGIVNIILIGVGALLLFSSLFPNQNMQIPRVPYSLFIDQVNDGEVKRAYITQEQIRYELNGAEEGAPSVLATTPIFDMDLPQRLESKGVEFAAAPPKKPNFFSTILSWVVPPLIFILVLQFFARRSMGGGGAQGALSFTKSKAKVYVPDDESKVTFADVAGVDEAKDELTEIVDFLKKPERYTDIGARIPKGVLLDTDLDEKDWDGLIKDFKNTVKEKSKIDFPQDVYQQLFGALSAVFLSWESNRAKIYRKLNHIPGDWGTAVNVQSMVFGNMGNDCATGVAFTRNPSTGENKFFGEYLINAQGEDVVAGSRTPRYITKKSREEAGAKEKSMEETMPKVFKELKNIFLKLKKQ